MLQVQPQKRPSAKQIDKKSHKKDRRGEENKMIREDQATLFEDSVDTWLAILLEIRGDDKTKTNR